MHLPSADDQSMIPLGQTTTCMHHAAMHRVLRSIAHDIHKISLGVISSSSSLPVSASHGGFRVIRWPDQAGTGGLAPWHAM